MNSEGNRRVRSWHIWPVVRIFVGVIGIILVANGTGQFSKSKAASLTPPALIPSGTSSINQTAQWVKKEVLLKNFINMYNGHIVYDPSDTAYPYKMWFFGWASAVCNPGYNGCDAIFFARSRDGNTWGVYAGNNSLGSPKYDTAMNPAAWVPVVTAQNTWYDQWHNGDPSVIKVGSYYFMAYSATGFDKDGVPGGTAGDADGDASVVMGAVSTDGITWQKRTAPLLASSAEYGSVGSIADTMYHRPSLLYENGKFKLWFDYWVDDVGGIGMGYAELPSAGSSADFLQGSFTFVQSGVNPAIINWPNPSIIHVGSLYYAYADPPQYRDPSPSGWKARKITEAVSTDGMSWQVTGYVDAEQDCAATHVPEAYSLNGKIYATYGCQNGGDPYDYKYGQIRRMSKSLASTIQGYKVTASRSSFTNPGAVVTVSGQGVNQTYSSSVNPYIAKISSGSYTVTSSIPSGYSVSYAMCINCASQEFDAIPFINGNSVTVMAPAGGYINLWWRYARTPTTYQASAGFSGAQGKDSWWYLRSFIGDNLHAKNLLYDTSQNLWAERNLKIWATGASPRNGADAIRRWVAPSAGSADISGSVSDADSTPNCGDGVAVSIKKGGDTLWGPAAIANGATSSVPFALPQVSLAAGDALDFIVNSGGANNHKCDATNFDPKIVFTPAE